MPEKIAHTMSLSALRILRNLKKGRRIGAERNILLLQGDDFLQVKKIVNQILPIFFHELFLAIDVNGVCDLPPLPIIMLVICVFPALDELAAFKGDCRILTIKFP
jgi:hypothetical protein